MGRQRAGLVHRSSRARQRYLTLASAGLTGVGDSAAGRKTTPASHCQPAGLNGGRFFKHCFNRVFYQVCESHSFFSVMTERGRKRIKEK